MSSSSQRSGATTCSCSISEEEEEEAEIDIFREDLFLGRSFPGDILFREVDCDTKRRKAMDRLCKVKGRLEQVTELQRTLRKNGENDTAADEN